MFTANTYIERRKTLKETVGSGIIFFPGNIESPMNYKDNTYLFRQDSSFLYYFGLNFPGVSAIIDVDSGQEMIFADEPTMADIIFLGPQEPLSDTALKAGVNETAPQSKLADILAGAAGQDRKVHYLPQYRAENVIRLEKLLSIPVAEIGKCVSVELIKAVAAQREIKTAEEITEMERSMDICHAMHVGAMKAARPGMYEYEVSGIIDGIAQSMNGRISFPIIFSIHGETLHNHYHGNLMKAGDIAINDSGAETAMNYSSDVTRTIPIGGKFTSRQKDIYNIVLKAQETCIDAVKPGVEWRDVHMLAGEMLLEGLNGLGLTKGDPKEAARQGAQTLFFQCGLGHQMGLDVHDMEDLGEQYVGYTDTIKRDERFGFRSLRMGKALEVGHVMTVEPGIYFIPELINRWKAENKLADFINYDKVEEYRDFGGVRLEDDVIVTEDGWKLLGKPIPKTIEEVEELAS
ncbi:MAG: aminopeptidase P N-terminal domain-containing protein [Phycisphaerae bacterium]|nr:aminopeptidase P N-terminal domain-containing protein [Phycisphaerae bacterium]